MLNRSEYKIVFIKSIGLFSAVQTERRIKNDIENAKLTEMRAERMAYEMAMEQQRIMQEEADKMSKSKKENKSKIMKKKKKKKQKIPMAITEYTTLDVDEDFAKIENEWYGNPVRISNDLAANEVSAIVFIYICSTI